MKNILEKFKTSIGLTIILCVIWSIVIFGAAKESNEKIAMMQEEMNQQQIQLAKCEERLKEMEIVNDLLERTKNNFKDERFALEEAVRNSIIFEIIEIEGLSESIEDKDNISYEYVTKNNNLFASEEEESAHLMEALIWTEEEAKVTFKKVSDINIKKILIDSQEIEPNKDGTYTILVRKRDAIKIEIIAEKTYFMWLTEGTHYWM